MTTESTGTATPAESTPIVAKGNSAVSFDDLEQMENAEARAKREKSSAQRRDAKAKAPDDQKEVKKDGVAPIDQGGAGRQPPKKDASARKPEAKKDGDGDAEADKGDTADDKEDQVPRKPAKVHKFRSGDDEHELSGDAIVTHMVNGKPEEIPLQELLNNYSGKVDYSRKYGEFGKEKAQFTKEKADLDGFVSEFFKRSQEDPDTAWDLLAEASGKDPIAFKEQMIRNQFAQMEHLFAMDEDEREKWFHEQKVGWREKNVNFRDKAQKDAQAKQQQTQEIQAMRENYGLDEDSWGQHYLTAKKLTNGKEPTPTQVVAASRYMMVFDSVKAAVPDLEKHPKYDTLVHSYVDDLMKNPSISKSQFENLLKEVWSKDDDTNLKKVSQKAIDSAKANGNDLRQKSKPAGAEKAWSFDQL